MTPGPTLTTARLILRPPQHEDFDAWAGMHAEVETMRFIGGAMARDASWRTMSQVAGSWAMLGFGMFAVIERDSGRWIGRIGPLRPGGSEGGWPGNEVGWGLIAVAQGKGYATEAAAAAMDWAFDRLGWDEVIHCIDKQNVASIRVAERLGSSLQREDVNLPPPFNTLVDLWGQSRDQWRSRSR